MVGGGQGESALVEFKEAFDPKDRQAELKLIREIVAFANSGGGTVVIGRRDDGALVGVDPAVVEALDPAKLCDKISSFVKPEALEVTVSVDRSGDRPTISLYVPACPMPPLVTAKDGAYGNAQTQKTVFRRGDVYARHGTKAEAATRADYVGWIDERVTAARSEVLNNLNFVASLPPGAVVSSLAGDEEIDEPNALLRRAGRAWQRNPEKLLTSTELASLLLTPGPLDLSDPAGKVLVHSALRKRATLWHWVARTQPGADWVTETIEEALAGSDRDKSDAGRAIVELAAICLGAEEFEAVRAELGASTYRHFRQAAEGVDQAAVVERLREQRHSATYGAPLTDWSIDDLNLQARTLARVVLGDGRHQGESRRISQIGLELFARTPAGAALQRPPTTDG
jgi:hypothetical protein